jgi:hypothetical protein
MLGENIKRLLKLSKWSRLVKPLVIRYGNIFEQWREHDKAWAGFELDYGTIYVTYGMGADCSCFLNTMI